jgi:hypothetical protein
MSTKQASTFWVRGWAVQSSAHVNAVFESLRPDNTDLRRGITTEQHDVRGYGVVYVLRPTRSVTEFKRSPPKVTLNGPPARACLNFRATCEGLLAVQGALLVAAAA